MFVKIYFKKGKEKDVKHGCNKVLYWMGVKRDVEDQYKSSCER